MYWQHEAKPGKQILVSHYPFPENTISFSLQEFTEKKCPIPLEEFEKYYGIPRGLHKIGFEKIKEYFCVQKADGFICFIGID